MVFTSYGYADILELIELLWVGSIVYAYADVLEPMLACLVGHFISESITFIYR